MAVNNRVKITNDIELKDRLVAINRVTKVTKGGRTFSFSAIVVVGNEDGIIGCLLYTSKFKPTTPGQRHKIIGTFEEITASVPEKSLVFGKRSTGGRNNVGTMTMRYMGGGQMCIRDRCMHYRRMLQNTNVILDLFECRKK